MAEPQSQPGHGFLTRAFSKMVILLTGYVRRKGKRRILTRARIKARLYGRHLLRDLKITRLVGEEERRNTRGKD